MDTIVAVSTPPGRSAIAVVRLTGPESFSLCRKLVRDEGFAPEPQRVTRRDIFADDDNHLLDEALITHFHSPHSFTGENLVEISCHGSPIILRRLLDQLQRYGARLAEPGEFTLRACRNGKLNLSQAEAIRDLIEAQTQMAASQATRQLRGELSNALQPAKEELIRVIVILESAIEFVEDDLPTAQLGALRKTLEKINFDLKNLASTYRAGHLLRDGLRVAIVGRPNVGKSSLFNSLLGLDRAIVTDIPGTTRDSLTEFVSIEGVPVSITDTAGLRAANDQIEVMGIERTRRAMADADILVLVIDGSEPLQEEDYAMMDHLSDRTFAVAVNKVDLPRVVRANHEFNGVEMVHISAATGEGIPALTAAILERCGAEITETGFLITDSRHHDLLLRACNSLESAATSLENAGEELVLADLHNALRFLGAITGETTPEEILGEIFSTFCIGK